MRVHYKNKRLEQWVVGLTVGAVATVSATFVMLYGFQKPVLSEHLLHGIQMAMLFVFLTEKAIRFFNAVNPRQFLRANWFEAPLLLSLLIVSIGAGRWFALAHRAEAILVAVSAYLVLQVISKVCISMILLAASGLDPSRVLAGVFIALIAAGTGLLMLPKAQAHPDQPISFTDAVFMAASATCVTGLVTKDLSTDFSRMGQIVILCLIQLGGLGIVIFGGVLALLLGQSLNVKESAAMQDLLNTQTLNQIGRMIAFIFSFTILIELIGAVCLYSMWHYTPHIVENPDQRWFCSIFHSVSAFCNAGFSLFGRNLMDYRASIEVYAVICPLIVIGGLGFGVLYNLCCVAGDKLAGLFRKPRSFWTLCDQPIPRKLSLQSKIVLTASAALIIFGTAVLWLFERLYQPDANGQLANAFFHSVSARTAGFNTVPIASLSDTSKLVLMLLMFIGGSSGSSAGGIKTTTFVLLMMVVYATLRKRREVELFGRSVRLVVVGRAITVTVLFWAALMVSIFGLCITERYQNFSLIDLAFEASSALGTVGLSCGITPTLTTAGKWIIIFTMLVGRLGPMSLLAALMFDVKPASYDYPSEPLMVG